MKSFFKGLVLLAYVCLSQSASAQYCTPVPGTAGAWIGQVSFSTLPGGTVNNTSAPFASQGYTSYLSASSGGVTPSCPAYFSVGMNSCGNRGPINFNLRVFADWNHDNDFDDQGEITADIDGTFLSGNCAFSTQNPYLVPPIGAATGNTRVRVAVREGGAKATACGNYVGEVEDYFVVVAANHAPVLDNSGIPFINPLIESQVNNNGFPLKQVLGISVTDADLCNVQKGVAIVGTSGSNGVWQYKSGAGSWTNIGAVTLANALLLPDTCRMRFVPSGAGTSGFTFKAWDKTSGTMNQYYNITASGNSTAFSSADEISSLTTYSAAQAASDIKLYMATTSSNSGFYDLYNSSLSRASGIMKEVDNTTFNILGGYGNDITMDLTNNKLVWSGGESGAAVMRSNYDGTAVEILVDGLSYPTGVAVGNNKIYVIDYDQGIYSMNPDGTGFTALFGGAGQANIAASGDIEFYNNKLYYVNQPGATGNFKIMQANTDATNNVELVSTPNYIYGLDVVNDVIYWVENTGTESMIKSMATTGGAITTIATNNNLLLDLFVDVSGSRIYVSIQDPGNIQSIYSIPVSGGAFTKRLILENSINSFVFDRPMATLPLRFVDVKAKSKQGGVEVNWTVASEDPNCTYTIERSLNGMTYSDAGTLKGQGKNSYSWIDENVSSGTVYYRIRATNADGKLLYSAIVKLSSSSHPAIDIFPTLVDNKTVNLRFMNQPAGVYQANVYNAEGQLIFGKQIQHGGGSGISSILLPGNIGSGVYTVTVGSGVERVTMKLVVK